MPIGIYKRKSWQDRFKEGVISDPLTSCRLWVRGTDRKGYGRFWLAGKDVRATHVAWLLAHNHLPTQQVLHKCDTPECVNPEHLFLGSIADNMKDKVAKGRQAKGATNGNSKLTEQIVLDILKSNTSNKNIAKKFGVHPTLVWQIKTGKIWKHVKQLEEILG